MIRDDPFRPFGTTLYAATLADWGCFDESEVLFRRALRARPDYVPALTGFAYALVRKTNPSAGRNADPAIRLCEQALALDPGQARSHYRLALALRWKPGGHGRAVEHLRRALKLRPDYRSAAALLAELTERAASA